MTLFYNGPDAKITKRQTVASALKERASYRDLKMGTDAQFSKKLS